MKKSLSLKSLLVSMAIASSAALSIAPATTQAGVSGNIGGVTNYVFRGLGQSGNKAAAQGGLDYEHESGIYVGTWASEVETGLEYDLYGGWGGEFSGVSLGAGFTYYGYTRSAFDKPYQEINLSVGFGPVSFGYDKGQHIESATDGGDADYSNIAISYEYESMSATAGMYDPDENVDDDANTYFELGYSTELAKGLDGSFSFVYSTPEDSKKVDDTYLIFGVSKSFDLM